MHAVFQPVAERVGTGTAVVWLVRVKLQRGPPMIPNPSELVNFGRSLIYGRHNANSAVSRAFQRGVFAARTGTEREDNPYPFGTHAYNDWIDGYESSIEVGRAMDLD